MSNYKEAARQILPWILERRKQLHEHPEVGFQERWTTDFIAAELKALGVEIVPWGGESGVVGLLRGSKPGPCVALRADIDGLPIEEKTGLDYSSKHPGFMHGCGHDTHSAALLGAAKLLADRREALNGTVKFIFQPAEELLTGAEKMIEAGVLYNPNVDFIFGQHNDPELPVGKALVGSGAIMACTASLSITVTGKGGHGAIPQKAKDPVLAAAGIIMAIQGIVSRQVDPLQAAVITIGSIHGGAAGNVIPDSVEMKGTMRVFEPKLQDDLEQRLRRTVAAAAEAWQTSAELVFTRVAPSVNNPEPVVDWLKNGPLAAVYGKENLLPQPRLMGSEDFARYQQKVPGAFIWFGAGGPECKAPLHNPHYVINTDALVYAAAAYAQVASERLDQN